MSKPRLYDDNPGKVLLQGDIFPEIDLLITESRFRSTENGLTEAVLSASSGTPLPTPEEVIPPTEKINPLKLVVIMSQTCDIRDSEYVVVSPIYTLRDYTEELKRLGKSAQSNIGLIKSRKRMWDKFYLEDLKISGNLEECYADLKKVHTISKGLLHIDDRIASLSHWGRQVLNYQLMWVYGRPVVEWD